MQLKSKEPAHDQPMVDLPIAAMSLKTLLRLILLLWHTLNTVESIKLVPVHSPLQQ
jgi:hypothetical protein